MPSGKKPASQSAFLSQPLLADFKFIPSNILCENLIRSKYFRDLKMCYLYFSTFSS